MKHKMLSFFLLMCIIFVSCRTNDSADRLKETHSDQTVVSGEGSARTLLINEIPLYDCILLDGSEQMLILDVTDSYALISIYDTSNMWNEQAESRQGIIDVTSRLILVNLESMEIVFEHIPKANQFYNDGLILAEKIIYTVIEIREDAESRYSINEIAYLSSGNSPVTEVMGGTCLAYDDYIPAVEKLSDTSYVFYHFDLDREVFEICQVVEESIKTHHHFEVDDFTHPLRNALKSANGTYILYAAIEGSGTLLLGNLNGDTNQIHLDENDRIYDYVLIADGIFLSLESGSVLLSLNGDSIITQSVDSPRFRIVSDGTCHAMHIDMQYNVYLMTASQENIGSIFISDIPANPALFYSDGAGTFFIHYYYEGEERENCERRVIRLDYE